MNAPKSTPAGELMHKTGPGTYWHLEQKPGTFVRKQPAYLVTKCGRRLGRWNMVTPQPLASTPTYDVCEGCRRKATEDPETAWLPNEESGELARLTRSVANRIDAGEDGIQCATGERNPAGFSPNSASRKPRTTQGQKKALAGAARQCGSALFGSCPIARECALAATARGDEAGIWGGIPAWALREARRQGPEALKELLEAAAAVLESDLDHDVDDVPLMTKNNVRGRQLVA